MWKNQQNKRNYFIFLSLLIIAGSFQSLLKSKFKKNEPIIWDPESIYNSTNYQSGLADPEGYLENYEDKIKIYNIIDEIKRLKNIDVTIILISKISNKYSKSNGKKDIAKFVDDISALIVHRNTEADSHSLIALFSVLDRQMQIRCGEEVKKVIDNATLASMLKGITSELKKANYGLATKKLLRKIFDEVTGADGSVLASIFALSMILGALWCICYSMVGMARSENIKNYVTRNLYDNQVEDKLKKIKEISFKNITKEEFVEKNCVICLENYSDEVISKFEAAKKIKREEEKNMLENEEENCEGGYNNVITPTTSRNSIIKVLEKNRNRNDNINIQIEEEKPLNNQTNLNLATTDTDGSSKLNKDEIPEVAILDCGHVFHTTCIAKWHEKQNKCPVCRNLIDANSNLSITPTETKSLQNGLVEIQTEIHPSLINYDFSYAPVFLWIIPAHLRHGGGAMNFSQGATRDANNYTSGFFEGGWNNGGGVEDFW